MSALPRILLTCALATPLALAGCDDASRAADPPPAVETAVDTAPDPRLAAVFAAVERGDAATARTLLRQLGARAGVPGVLAEARLLLIEGDAVGALREIERARALLPGDGRVYAAAAEVYAGLGRVAAAEEELERGLVVAGDGPELMRARGVVLLSRQGGAEPGLTALERARAIDPELPYVDAPLFQGHVLAGRLALAEERAPEALAHADAALALRPDQLEARELRAEGLAATGRLAEAVAAYEDLRAAGRPVDATLARLCHNTALALLLAGEREAALERWIRARELGLPEDQMRTGAHQLRDEARAWRERGAERHDAGDVEAAIEAFREALRHDPDDLAARHFLGVALYRAGDFAGAAASWSAVLATAEEEGLALPDPVHLDLARALRGAGEAERARLVLEGWLEGHPDGPWLEQTRALLDEAR